MVEKIRLIFPKTVKGLRLGIWNKSTKEELFKKEVTANGIIDIDLNCEKGDIIMVRARKPGWLPFETTATVETDTKIHLILIRDIIYDGPDEPTTAEGPVAVAEPADPERAHMESILRAWSD